MALSLFKTSEPEAPVRPARAALRDHLDIDQGIVKQIAEINARLRIINDDIKAADSMSATIHAQREAIDARLAEARYRDAPAPDVTAERRALADIEQRFVKIAELARIGAVVKPKLQTDADVLVTKRHELKPATDRLLWAAIVEEGVSHLAKYLDARKAMIAIAHKTFGAFLAADTIAKENSFGVFNGSSLYNDMHIPLPTHPAYQRSAPGPEAARRQRSDDAALVSGEAADLVNRLLNGVRG